MIHLPHDQVQDGALRDLAPDLTPMLDILFILLVFFMITAGAIFQSLDLKLPASISGELVLLNEPQHIMVEIHEDKYVLDGTAVADFQDLTTILLPLIHDRPQHKIIVAGDRNATIERLLMLLGYLQAQGIEAANILMRDAQAQGAQAQ